MKKSTQYMIWSAVISSAFAFSAACGGNGGGSGGNGDGDGDGDGDSGDGDSGDGDGDSGDGDSGDGDGDNGDGDGDNGDGDGDGDGLGGNGGAMSMDCPEECPNDDNPCTEDACNPETGECGIPRTGNACNDGIYCNGADTCEEGECSGHAGNPCGNPDACDEGENECGCATVSDCPGEDLSAHEFGGADQWGTIGEFGEAAFDNVCDEASTCSATKTLYECANMACVSSNSTVTDTTCTERVTDGVACTDNGTYCDGDEVCSGGVCNAHTGNPCAGNPPESDECRESNDSCVECLDDGDCIAAEKCCNNACIPDENTCFIVIQNISQNIIAQNLIAQNLVAQNLIAQNLVLQNLQALP